MFGENEFLDWLRSKETQRKASPLVRIGIGDDMAALRWPADELMLVGVDQVLDGVHFDSAMHGPRDIGRKAMNRNLSDCAAMACQPAAAVATVALPKGVGPDYAKELYAGMAAAAGKFDCPIVGGDTGSWGGKLVMTVTIFGRSAGMAPVTRGGAKVGDAVFVTGPLGGSILGRHMTFEPRVELAWQLRGSRLITAMMDLSDGLSMDLPRLCSASKVGAVIDVASVPIHADAVTLAQRDGRTALEHALHDGEDYELLLTSPDNRPDPRLMRIGTIVAERGVWIEARGVRLPLDAGGWEHAL